MHCGTRNNVSSRGQSTLSKGDASKPKPNVPTSASQGHGAILNTPRAGAAEAVATVTGTCARKRPPALDFDSVWAGVRKKQRTGRSQELGSLVDLVNGLGTTKAKAAKKHINERIGPWSRRYNFSKPQHYDEGIAQFRSKGGGGSGGVGVTQEFAKAIVRELGQT